jgi:excisionase family DNA binding protein
MNSTAPAKSEPPSFSRQDLLTATEVAEVLRLRRTTALDYMRRGVIPAFKIGRSWYALRSRLDDYLVSASHSAERS